MKNLQKDSIKKILEGEQLTISKLAENVEINRTTLSKLINQNLQLTDINWKKIKEAYPEYTDNEIKVEKVKEKVFKDLDKDLGLKPVEQKAPKIEVQKENNKNVEQQNIIIGNKPHDKKIVIIKNVNELKKFFGEVPQKEIKTKAENRHKNLNCPESGYHMKVPYKQLLRARPMCPITGLPMMLKEEIRKLRTISDESEKKKYLESLTTTINLLNK